MNCILEELTWEELDSYADMLEAQDEARGQDE